jgi:4-amino-4-deoxy-L-arabinose transferase-like glycosyltransferase
MLALLVYILNLFVDIMDVDATQYAEISWEMLSTKSFLKVHSLGADYLDKPPLLFWFNAACFSLFGAGTVTYKLPSLLFAILAVYSTYRFARIYYSEQTALMAALMLATTEALFLITNDVRTDTMLMGAIMFAIWQWTAFFDSNKTKNIILGSIGLGLALLAKGPIALIVLTAALLPHIILSKKWHWLLDIRMLLALAIVILLLSPMCLGLYQQWGWKGIRFYFWTQSFGRITGENEWKNNPDTFFLIHTSLWAFIPWSLFLFAGWAKRIIDLIKKRAASQEVISITGFTLVLISLMLSQYQLPHYVFVIYPLGAVIAADYFTKLGSGGLMQRILSVIQLLTLFAFIIASIALQYCLKGADPLSLGCLIILYAAAIGLILYTAGPVKSLRNAFLYLTHSVKKIAKSDRGPSPETHVFFDMAYRNLILSSATMMIVFNFLIGAFYYPAILKYQPSADFGRYVRQHQNGEKNLVAYMLGSGYADAFYAQQIPLLTWDPAVFAETLKQKKHLIVYTNPTGIDELNKAHIRYKIIEQRYHYQVGRLSLPFLNPATRDAVCDKVYLLEADL